MPIYSYKCESCGFSKDVLQKISDEPLTVCPSCGAASFAKQVTAAGFRLKGTGWYVTDFRNEGSGASAKEPSAASDGSAAESPAPAASPAPAPAPAAAPAPAPAAAPASGPTAK